MSAPTRPGQGLLLALVAFAIAILGSLCGVGGGIFAVPALHYAFRLEMRAAVATSLVLVLATSVSATVTEILHPRGELHLDLILCLTTGSLLGAELGLRLARRISVRALKGLFCLLLIGVGIRLVLSLALEPVAQSAAAETHGSGLASSLLCLAIGLLAGIGVPLLGIGGGLVVVPAVLFFLPTVGYLGARSASLAMASVTSARSTLAYQRQARIDWPKALPFALGALAGGAVGVRLVHLRGATLVGEALLGATLLIAATRFALDFLRGPPAPAPGSPSGGAAGKPGGA